MVSSLHRPVFKGHVDAMRHRLRAAISMVDRAKSARKSFRQRSGSADPASLRLGYRRRSNSHCEPQR